MQAGSDKKLYPHFERIDRYRVQLGLTWNQVAEKLNVSVAMLMMTKSGKRKISSKVIARLEKAESEAGLTLTKRENSPEDNRISDYIAGLPRNPSQDEIERYFAEKFGPIIQQTSIRVTDADIERGYVVTPPLEFLTEGASETMPDTVRLNRLSTKAAAVATTEAIESCDPAALLETALEDRLEGREPHEIIRLLTPFAIFNCVRAVLILSFGKPRANELLIALGYDRWIKFANDVRSSRQRKKETTKKAAVSDAGNG